MSEPLKVSSNASSPPRIAFLGIAERATQVPDGNTSFLKYNIGGLKAVLFSFIFPTTIAGCNLVFALFDILLHPISKIRFTDSDGKELGHITLETSAISAQEYSATFGRMTFSYFNSPDGQGNWNGISFGFSFPPGIGVGLTQVNYDSYAPDQNSANNPLLSLPASPNNACQK